MHHIFKGHLKKSICWSCIISRQFEIKTFFDYMFLKEHLEYDVVRSVNPDFKKAIVRINIFKQHRQTIQVCSFLAFIINCGLSDNVLINICELISNCFSLVLSCSIYNRMNTRSSHKLSCWLLMKQLRFLCQL